MWTLLLGLAGCPAEAPAPTAMPVPGFGTAAPMGVPGATGLPGVPIPQATAAPVLTAAPVEEGPAIAVAEGMTEVGWHAAAEASIAHGTVLAAAPLTDSVVGLVRAQGTTFVAHLVERGVRAAWLDADVASFAIFAEKRGEIGVVYRKRGAGQKLFAQRFSSKTLAARRGPVGGAATLACEAGLASACTMWVDDALLVARTCGMGGGAEGRFGLFDEQIASREEGATPPSAVCGTSLGGHSPAPRSTWGAFGYFGGRAGFRSSQNGEIQAKVEDGRLQLLRRGSSTAAPRSNDLGRPIQKALQALRERMRDQFDETDESTLQAIVDEFPTDAEYLALRLRRATPENAVLVLRASMARLAKPSLDDLRRHLCAEDDLGERVQAAMRAGVPLPCELIVTVETGPSAPPETAAAATTAPETAAPATETAAPETAAPPPETAAPPPETAAPPPETAAPEPPPADPPATG